MTFLKTFWTKISNIICDVIYGGVLGWMPSNSWKFILIEKNIRRFWRSLKKIQRISEGIFKTECRNRCRNYRQRYWRNSRENLQKFFQEFVQKFIQQLFSEIDPVVPLKISLGFPLEISGGNTLLFLLGFSTNFSRNCKKKNLEKL